MDGPRDLGADSRRCNVRPAGTSTHEGASTVVAVRQRRPASRYAAGILTRRTFRTFEREPVPQALRASLLEAASQTPSADDADFVRYVVIDDPALKKRLFRLPRESKDISKPLGAAVQVFQADANRLV